MRIRKFRRLRKKFNSQRKLFCQIINYPRWVYYSQIVDIGSNYARSFLRFPLGHRVSLWLEYIFRVRETFLSSYKSQTPALVMQNNLRMQSFADGLSSLLFRILYSAAFESSRPFRCHDDAAEEFGAASSALLICNRDG
jgi:hypothetical protein